MKVDIKETTNNWCINGKVGRYTHEIYVEKELFGLMYIGDEWTPMFKSYGSPEEELTASELIHIGTKMKEVCNSIKEEAQKNNLSHRQWLETL